MLRQMDYSLQGNRKADEGSDHPDRDAQFQYINEQVRKALAAKRPVISVDTKKKEILGNYQNKGQQWRKAKSPQRVNVHDFPSPTVPRAYPYGIYDLGRNTGFVNVGTDHDTGAFAVASIRGWWRAEGRRLYPAARTLLITADSGGSNGYRLRHGRWNSRGWPTMPDSPSWCVTFLPGPAREQGGAPPLFLHLIQLARRTASRLRDDRTSDRRDVTTTAQGLKVTCRLDRRAHPVGRKVSDKEIATVNLEPHSFHGEWNYIIRPRM